MGAGRGPEFAAMDTSLNQPSTHASEWADVLAECEAEVAAGQTIPLAPVLADLRSTADRLEAKRRAPGPLDRATSYPHHADWQQLPPEIQEPKLP